jgi:hypothetical protein
MRCIITVGTQDPHRECVRSDAEFWLPHYARYGWRVRERQDYDERQILIFEFDDPSDAWAFYTRAEVAERRGRLD